MVAERIAAADLAVQPEGQVRERARLPQRPDLQPAARGTRRIGENGIIVEVKAEPSEAQRRPTTGERRRRSMTYYELT